MEARPDVIAWTETLRMRRRAQGRGYWRYLARALGAWALWWGGIFLVVAWWNGHPPWRSRAAEVVCFTVCAGTLMRAFLETLGRSVRLESDRVTLGWGTAQETWILPPNQPAVVAQSGGGILRLELTAVARHARQRKLVLGAPDDLSEVVRRYRDARSTAGKPVRTVM